jgi:peroxiredoxin
MSWMMDARRWTIVFIGALFLGGAWIILSRVDNPIGGSGALPNPQVGFSAPDFTLDSLIGDPITLSDLRGQVVVLNFWASWCGPCRVEMPHLNRLYDKYRASGFTLLGVNVDDDPRLAGGAAGRMGVRFPVLLDADKAVSRLYALASMPSTYVIDRDGRLRYLHKGYRDGVEELYERQVRELVKE